MECDLLTMDIGSCTDKAYKGFNRIGWWTQLSNIDPASLEYNDAGVKFALRSGQFYEIYDGSATPFEGTAPQVAVTGRHGFKQYSDRVAFPLKELSPNSAALIKSLTLGIPIVVILEQTDGGEGRFPVYGVPAGLHGAPEMSYELNDERCWEVVLQSFNTGYPQRFLFDTDEATTLAWKKLLTSVGTTFGGGTVIYADFANELVTVVPDGYAPDDQYSDEWSNGDAFCAAYVKNGFSDYAMISPAEVTALMTSPDLLTKTGLTAEDTWTNITNIGLTEAQYWDNSEGEIATTTTDNVMQIIPVRRVAIT